MTAPRMAMLGKPFSLRAFAKTSMCRQLRRFGGGSEEAKLIPLLLSVILRQLRHEEVLAHGEPVFDLGHLVWGQERK